MKPTAATAMDRKDNDTLNASQILHLALQKMDGIIAVNADVESLSVKSDFVLSDENINLESLPTNCTRSQSNSRESNISSPSSNNNNNNNDALRKSDSSPSYHHKQDKLNRLLQELKEYSKEDGDEISVDRTNDYKNNNNHKSYLNHNNENARIEPKTLPAKSNIRPNSIEYSVTNNRHSLPMSPINNNNNNLNSSTSNNSSGNPTPPNCAENVDKLQAEHPQQQQSAQHHHHTHQLEKSSNLTPEYLHDSTNLNDTSAEHERDSALFSSSQYVNGDHQQIISQSDRIAHLESFVSVLRNQLLNTEDLFKKALISKKTLENTNANLLAVIDKLKLELSHSETHRKLNEEHNISVEGDIGSLKNLLLEKETEISSLRLTMAKIVRSTGYMLSENELALLRGKTIASDFIKNKLIKDIYSDGTPRSVPVKPNAFYSEPSSRRDSFSSALYGRPSSPIVGYQSAHPSPSSTPLVRSNQTKYASSTLPSSSMLRSTSAENMKMNSGQSANSTNHAETTPEHHSKENKYQRKFNKNPYSTLPHNSKTSRQIQKHLEDTEKRVEMDKNRHHSNNEISDLSQPQLTDQPQQPQPQSNSYLNKKVLSTPSSPLNTFKSPVHEHQMSGVTFAKDDEIIPSSLQSSTSEMQRNGVSPPRVISNDSKLKSFRRIFSRKRSNSSLSGLSDVFSRGGFRATSGPRLGHSTNGKSLQNVNIPFSQWDTTLVADWFALIGLGMYVNECRRWCKNGEHLMRATSADVEKELGIRNPLHRKKLRLAVAAMNDDEDELLKNAGKLDYLWIARWLDDIGLPQYKDAFIDARVDGRVLHYLAVEDLFYLKVTSQLHFASIRSGIRILRDNNYSNQCLKRRAAPEEANQTEWASSEVSHWSSHRVMEWLRSIDLSEYAPNLRGSGVHGALILFENAFNADLFSTLLSIPTSKTLLRRHISAKFKQLVGDDLSKIKLEYECQPNYTPMIPGSKVKAFKKGHFTLRKKRSDFELADYVCPMTPAKSTRSSLITMMKRNCSQNTTTETTPSSSSNAEWRNSMLRQSSLPSTKSVQVQSPSPAQNKQLSTSTANNNSSSNNDSINSSENSPSKSDTEISQFSVQNKNN